MKNELNKTLIQAIMNESYTDAKKPFTELMTVQMSEKITALKESVAKETYKPKE
jgi:hypothetical protein